MWPLPALVKSPKKPWLPFGSVYEVNTDSWMLEYTLRNSAVFIISASSKKVILLPSSYDCTFSSSIGRHELGIASQLARML